MDAAYYRDLIRPLIGGRRVVLCGVLLNASTALVNTLRELGAERCLVLAHGLGTGAPPSAESADRVVVETPASDMIQEFRQVERLFAHLPRPFLDALERFDPDRTALVLAPFVSIGPLPEALDGRRLFGRRQAASLAFEDKVTVDAFWDQAGLARAPSAVISAKEDELRRAFRRLDRGRGAVIAADAREGIHGGGERLRWARAPAELPDAVSYFGPICDRVRVMPFLEGIPCSIHGLVFPDYVVAVRPVEMVTFRQPPRLRYCGAATFWDPPPERREEMRGAAKKVGETLRRMIGFRGAFTIDGVMTEAGFLPTEHNPRFGAGLAVLSRGLAGLPLGLLQLAIVEGQDLDFQPAALEEMLVGGADQHRSGGAWTVVSRVFSETHEVGVVDVGGQFRHAGAEELTHATVTVGPSNLGGFVRYQPDPERTPAGGSIAARAVAAFAFADQELGTGIGPLQAAQDLSSS